MTVLSMSLIAVIPILLIIVLRALALNKLPKKLFVALWGLVLIRLVIPFTIPTSLKTDQVIRPISNATDQANSIDTTIRQTVNQLTNSGQVSEDVATHSGFFSSISPLFLIWIVFFILILSFFVGNHLRCLRTYKTALPVDDPALKNWLVKQTWFRRVQLRQSDQISSPLTYGVLRPVILLPKTMADADIDQTRHVLTHELTHIKRFDLVFKWLLIIALSVHWFNPLVWVMYVLTNRDLEMSCDETVIKKFGNKITTSYALTLIQLTELNSKWTPLHSHFSKHAIEERIVSIMRSNQSSFWGTIGAFFLVIGSVLVFSITPVEAQSLNLFDQIETAEQIYDYDEFLSINRPYDHITMATSAEDQLYIEATAFTDHLVYAIIGIEGPIITDVEVEAIAVDPYIEKTLFGLDGELKELAPEGNVRYFLYRGKITDLDVTNRIQRFFTNDTDFLKSVSLRDYHQRLIEFNFALNGSEYLLTTMIENVSGQAYTFLLDPKDHGEGFYDQAILTSTGIRFSGTKSTFEDDWESPDFSITIVRMKEGPIELDSDQIGIISTEEFTASHSRGRSFQTEQFYNDIDFDRSKLDLTDVEALIINGVTYRLNN